MKKSEVKAYEWWVKHGACQDELRDIDAHGGTTGEYYRECSRGDRLLWALVRSRPSEEMREALNRAVEKFLSRVIEKHALHCGIEFVEHWAQRWLSGEDRSLEAAAEAAEVAAAAEAEAAAWVAEAAASAAWVAEGVEAAWDEELSRIADDIRSEIPEWPGEE